MTAASPRKRQRIAATHDAEGLSDDGDHPETSARGASRTLASFSHPTTVIKCNTKARLARSRARKDDEDVTQIDPPLSAFPRLSSWEQTTRPAEARRSAYILAKRRLDERIRQALDEGCLPMIREAQEWLDGLESSDHSLPRLARRTTLPLAAVEAASPDPLSFHVLTEKLLAANRTSRRVNAAVLSANEASYGSVGAIIEACCQKWLRGMAGGEGEERQTSQRGAMAAWQQMRATYQQLETSPTLLLVLPSLPPTSSPLFSTLSYLVNLPNSSTSESPTLAILLQSSIGPAGIDSLDTSERRCLDVSKLTSPATGRASGAQELLCDLFWPSSLQSSDQVGVYPRLPSQCLKYALQYASASAASATTTAGELLLLDQWLTLALQYHYTHDHLSAFLSISSGTSRTSPDLSSEDFTAAFFISLRTHMIRALRGEAESDTPDLALLPEGLNTRSALRKLLTDDGFLLQHCHRMAQTDRAHAWGEQEIGRGMLAEIVLPLADNGDQASGLALGRDASVIYRQAVSSLRFALLTDLSTKEKDSPMRKKVADLLAPSLRALRRTDSEGGLSISFLDTWLDKAEDWAQGLVPSSSPTDSSDLPADTPSTSGATVVQERMLEQIRTLQQSLKIFRDQVGDLPASADASEVPASEEERVKVVQRKLRTEEGLRAFRKECADWVGAEVRSLLLSKPPLTSLFPTSASASSSASTPFSNASEETAGEDFTATLESLLSPSPRQNLSLALARPEVYLAHFLASAQGAASLSTPSGIEPGVLEQLGPLVNGRRSQTDLSTAFNLLREAGGAGTGVKGRLVEVVDWFHAWCSLQQQQQQQQRSNGDETHLNGASSASTSTSPGKKRKTALGTPASAEQVAGAPSLQARFALALSSLALLGYIKKTAKRSARGGAGGALVLKVGGWDKIPGLVEHEGIGEGDAEEVQEEEQE